MKWEVCQNINSLSSHPFYIKITPKGFSGHAVFLGHIKSLKMPTSKFGQLLPFFAILCPLPPFKKFHFWLPDNYACEGCQSNHCVQKPPKVHFLVLPMDQCQRNSPKKMKWEVCQNINSLSSHPFYIKITPKGFSGLAEFPGHIKSLKMPTSKFGQFWPFFAILCPLPPLKKFHFWLPDNYAWEGCQSNHCVQKPPKVHFLVLSRDQCQRNSPKKMKWELCQNINSLSSHPFYIKITPKGFSGHAEFPGHIKSLKMPTSKFGQFWPFFAILCPLPPLKKFHFWLPNNYAWEGCQSNHCVQKPPKVHFLVLPRDQCQRNSPKKMKWEVCQNINSLSSHPFYIKITPKGFSGLAEFPGHIKSLKMPTSKFGQFWPFFAILCPLPPLKKFHFWLPDNYAWEGCQSNHCVQKPPKVHFLVLSRDQCQRNSPKKMKWELCQNINSLSSHPFYIKITPKGFSGHAEFPGHIKSLKMPTSKFGQFWPFFAILCPLPPLKKFHFWLPNNYAWEGCQSNHCVQKPPKVHFLVLPRDQCQRNSPKKMKWEVCQNINSLSSHPFYIKITPKGFSGLAEFPGHIKSLKMPTSKFGQFWPFFTFRARSPLWKNSICGSPTIMHGKAANRTTVSKNLPRYTF